MFTTHSGIKLLCGFTSALPTRIGTFDVFPSIIQIIMFITWGTVLWLVASPANDLGPWIPLSASGVACLCPIQDAAALLLL